MRTFRYVAARGGVALGVVVAVSRADAMQLAARRWPGEGLEVVAWSRVNKATREAATAAEVPPDLPDGVP